MQGNRIVAATLGVALSVGGMLATAGTASAASGPSVKASAWSSCNDRERVVIRVTVKNKENRAVSVRVRTDFGNERVVIGGNDERTLSFRTGERRVDDGSVTVRSRKLGRDDTTTISPSYRDKRCHGGGWWWRFSDRGHPAGQR